LAIRAVQRAARELGKRLFVDTHLEQMRRALNDLSQFMAVKIEMAVLAV